MSPKAISKTQYRVTRTISTISFIACKGQIIGATYLQSIESISLTIRYLYIIYSTKNWFWIFAHSRLLIRPSNIWSRQAVIRVIQLKQAGITRRRLSMGIINCRKILHQRSYRSFFENRVISNVYIEIYQVTVILMQNK